MRGAEQSENHPSQRQMNADMYHDHTSPTLAITSGRRFGRIGRRCSRHRLVLTALFLVGSGFPGLVVTASATGSGESVGSPHGGFNTEILDALVIER